MNNAHNTKTPLWIQWSHLGIVMFGITSYLTAELAEDYQGLGYLLHAYLGMALLLFLFSRCIYGFVGIKLYRFTHWLAYKRSYLKSVQEDLRSLIKLKLPDRQDHQGIAGLVQAFGFFVFLWMAVTGTILYINNAYEDSIISELHEAGEDLIPIFLCFHIGAVLLHYLFQKNLLPHMFSMFYRNNS